MENDDQVICTYLSQRQRLSTQTIEKPTLMVDEKDEPVHIQGWCANKGSPRTLRYDHVLAFHDTYEEAKASN